jgi:hypothetical protein
VVIKLITITNKEDLRSLIELLLEEKISNVVNYEIFGEQYTSNAIKALAEDIIDINVLWCILEEKKFTIFHAETRREFLIEYIHRWCETVPDDSLFWNLVPYYNWDDVWHFLINTQKNQISPHYGLGIVIDYTE